MISSPQFAITLVFSVFLTANSAQAQPNSLAPLALGANATISLITEGPGKDLYLAFGHTALRVRDPDQALDLLFNYGTIDPAYLSDPTFVGRFLLGDLRYSLGAEPFQDALEYDIETQNRIWVEQVLNFTPYQKDSVYRFLIWNALPENKSYQYDFIRDNCASRIPSVLEKVLGPVLVYPSGEAGKAVTARSLIEASLSNRSPWNILVTLGLGAVADQPLKPRETAFMPESLRSLFSHSSIKREGNVIPLVGEENILYSPGQHGSPVELFDLGLVLWVLAGGVVFKSLWDSIRRRCPKRNSWWKNLPDRLLFGIAGLGGALIFYLTFFSQHVAAQANFHLLWMWPTHLVVALLPWKNPRAGWMRWYWVATTAMAMASVVLWPWWPQRNLMIVVPVLVLLAVRAVTLAQSKTPVI